MNPIRRLPVSGLLLALLGTSPGAAQEIRFPVAEQKLDNGLRVLVVEDHAVPAITCYTFFNVGSRDERPGRTGISHLFEHMMFNGSKKYGRGEFDRQLESRGGVSNAFTTEDITAYSDTFPSEALELVLDMEADRMGALLIGEESLAAEREVVKEERRLRIDNDVQGAMFELLGATAYVAHPYGWPVVGWMSDLDAITVDDCQEYFRVHYAPNNATLILAGDVRKERAFELVRKAFSGIPAQPPAVPVVANEPPQKGERRAVLRKAAQVPAVAMAFHVPPSTSDDVYALDLVETLLATGDSSRLTRSLVRERQVASWVSAGNAYRVDPSVFLIAAEARPEVPIETLEKALLDELERLARDPVADAELQKARNLRTMSLVKALKTSRGKAEQLGLYQSYFGSYKTLFEAVGKYQAVDREAIRKAAASAFRADNRSVVTLVPAAEEGAP
jgi:predicted Zn-dependent peptidase